LPRRTGVHSCNLPLPRFSHRPTGHIILHAVNSLASLAKGLVQADETRVLPDMTRGASHGSRCTEDSKYLAALVPTPGRQEASPKVLNREVLTTLQTGFPSTAATQALMP